MTILNYDNKDVERDVKMLWLNDEASFTLYNNTVEVTKSKTYKNCAGASKQYFLQAV